MKRRDLLKLAMAAPVAAFELKTPLIPFHVGGLTVRACLEGSDNGHTWFTEQVKHVKRGEVVRFEPLETYRYYRVQYERQLEQKDAVG